MARQNRVTPFGEILATTERGTVMGNRGVLHEAGRIVRAWQVRRWLLCRLEFKGRKRAVMSPGRYTELFFLDEATGLAAGHRPCAECRRDGFTAFSRAWLAAGLSEGAKVTAAAIDERLHAERLAPRESRRARLEELPDGVFFTLQESGGDAYLVWDSSLLRWSPGGYRERQPRPKGMRVWLLTPRSTVEAIRAGYTPEVHPSADPERAIAGPS
jgi:hypothetical protein